ncbi:transposase domain-containing protein [Aliidongia dinghuensis]|uniref:transposase domain-containing protein n=1 Tax=Aliidongia dinghuensis TaxID=1867774 RepID=UPI003898F699
MPVLPGKQARNDLDSEAYLRETLAKIAEGHPIRRIDELLPWVQQGLCHGTPGA